MYGKGIISPDGTVLKDKLAIVTDLTCGFTNKTARELGGIDVVNFPVSYKRGNEVIGYKDGNENSDEFYIQLADKRTTGAMTGSGIEDFKRLFEDRLKEGKLVVYLGVTSSLSEGMSNSARAAREMICAESPDLDADENILILPTHCVAGGLGLSLRILCAWLNETPRTVEELKEKVAFLGDHMAHIFSLFSFDYMKRSGRFSSTLDKAKIALAETMRIYPIMFSPRNGKLQPNWKKARGNKKLLETFVGIYAETAIDPENGLVEVDYSGPSRVGSVAFDMASELRKALRARFPGAKVIMAQTSPSVGCHVGPAEISMFFLQKEVRPDVA